MGQAIYYTTIMVCAFGCVSRIILAGYYRMLLRALRCMKTTKNKWMQKMKEQFILRYQAMLGVQNIENFVDKFFYERKLLGISISVWTGLHIQWVSICFLLGLMNAIYGCIQGMSAENVLTTMFQGIWTSALLLLVDGFCMVQGKVKALKCGMKDYLENYLQVCLEHEYHVWGKNREELRQTKAVLEAQMQIIDEKAYRRQKKEARKLSETELKQQEKLLKAERRQEKKLSKAEHRQQEKLLKAERRQEEKFSKVERRQEDKLLKAERKQQKITMAKRRPEVEKKVREDVQRLKQEVENRRRIEAEVLATHETAHCSSQVEEILQGLL